MRKVAEIAEQIARLVLQTACIAIAAPAAAWWRATGRKQGVFEATMQAACWVPGAVGSAFRVALLKLMSAGVGGRARIEIGTLFSDPRVRIGNGVYIGPFCDIGWASIEEFALLGSGVHVTSGKHTHLYNRADVPIALQGGSRTEVRIGRGAWIGNRAVVMADVGEECVVGSGAVVTRPIPPWSIAVGVPARVIGSRAPGQPAAQIEVAMVGRRSAERADQLPATSRP